MLRIQDQAKAVKIRHRDQEPFDYMYKTRTHVGSHVEVDDVSDTS